MPRRFPPWMASGGSRPPSRPSTTAPMLRSGSTMRAIGRRRNCSPPLSTLRNCCPAIKPASKRMVVPERRQSSTFSGSCRPCNPTPCTVSVVGECSSISTPRDRTASSVARQSAAGKKPSTRLLPVAIAPSSSARCEIDLSPGTRALPRSGAPGRDRQVAHGNISLRFWRMVPRVSRRSPSSPASRDRARLASWA